MPLNTPNSNTGKNLFSMDDFNPAASEIISRSMITASFNSEERFDWTPSTGLRVGIPDRYGFVSFERTTVEDLYKRLFPFPAVQDQSQNKAPPKLPAERSLAWWYAQLIHYGLPITRTREEARESLKRAITMKRLVVPPRFRELEAKFKRQYVINPTDRLGLILLQENVQRGVGTNDADILEVEDEDSHDETGSLVFHTPMRFLKRDRNDANQREGSVIFSGSRKRKRETKDKQNKKDESIGNKQPAEDVPVSGGSHTRSEPKKTKRVRHEKTSLDEREANTPFTDIEVTSKKQRPKPRQPRAVISAARKRKTQQVIDISSDQDDDTNRGTSSEENQSTQQPTPIPKTRLPTSKKPARKTSTVSKSTPLATSASQSASKSAKSHPSTKENVHKKKPKGKLTSTES